MWDLRIVLDALSSNLHQYPSEECYLYYWFYKPEENLYMLIYVSLKLAKYDFMKKKLRIKQNKEKGNISNKWNFLA